MITGLCAREEEEEEKKKEGNKEAARELCEMSAKKGDITTPLGSIMVDVKHNKEVKE